MRKFVLEILDLLSEGLRLGRGYLGGEMSSNPTMFVNYYPPCPDPTLTLGLRQHCDGSLITILFQDVNGLQILKDGQWIAAHPIDDALLINFGYVFEVVSNGKLKASEHRVVTNTKVPRQSLTYLAYPQNDVIIEPAKCLINEANPPHYRSMKFEDFKRKHNSVLSNKEEIMKYMSLNKPE
ncbi:unnamed protein product [Citrullus colocynthis]|uniref:Fe2OG dioxygenase domain-containing protein n=1 Tax=Citrullus colocynthis TaxID=252529 RepID=A0ABP0XTP3_9ROSI